MPACQNYQRCLCVNCIECILADRFTIPESRNSLIPLIRNADRRILRLSNCEIFCRVLGPIGQLALPSFRPAWMHPKNLPFFICKPPKSPCVPRNKSVSVSDLIVCQWWLVSIVKFDSAELTSATQQDCWIRSRSIVHATAFSFFLFNGYNSWEKSWVTPATTLWTKECILERALIKKSASISIYPITPCPSLVHKSVFKLG